MNNLFKYLIAYVPDQVFVEKSTGAIFTNGGMFGESTSLFMHLRRIIAGFGGPILYTEDQTTLSKGIGASSCCIENVSHMKEYEYVGRL